MNPAPNRRGTGARLGKEFASSGLADLSPDSVVVGKSRAKGGDLERIGELKSCRLVVRKCLVVSQHCNCNARSPECHEA